ncbi:class I SAM-dependent methyltransferase [Kitasatospora sp. NPDC049285]|uniref:class I SAM-dependent methyltransferase n=1 Tax=Kitasatospora sp. NPDC049285 TaxID=3157096 RepID=UPI0034416C62
MIDYDDEARTYDESRGGEQRARAAAEAVQRLLPDTPGTVLDLGCGTGIVTRHLQHPGRRLLGVDRSGGMLALAAQRLPGAVVLGDGARLPFRTGSIDAVVSVWLLHLLAEPLAVLAEARRCLAPGGRLVTTVDKDDAYFVPDSDLAALTAPLRREHADRASDSTDRITTWAAGHGLQQVAETSFPGRGQGRSPRAWLKTIRAGRIPWCNQAEPGRVAELCRRLEDLPGQDQARPDPLYRLIALQA